MKKLGIVALIIITLFSITSCGWEDKVSIEYIGQNDEWTEEIYEITNLTNKELKDVRAIIKVSDGWISESFKYTDDVSYSIRAHETVEYIIRDLDVSDWIDENAKEPERWYGIHIDGTKFEYKTGETEIIWD